MKIILILCSYSLFLGAQSIDFERLDSPSVQLFLKSRSTAKSFEPSCHKIEYNADNEIIFPTCKKFKFKSKVYKNTDYRLHQKDYRLKVSKHQFFETLLNSSPNHIWNSKSQFQLKINELTDTIHYKSDSYIEPVKIGDNIFLNLNIGILKNLIHQQIPVAFQVVNLDEHNGIVAFSYLIDNESKGIQYLKITEVNQSEINITHYTRYLSGRGFRDRVLYEYFHEKMTDDFYYSLEKLILGN